MLKDKYLQSLADKLKLSLACITDIIVCDHLLKHLIPKKAFATMEVPIDGKSYKKMERIAKNLKVDTNSVMCILLEKGIQSKENQE